MKADRSILAEGDRAPGWFARYRFYSRGRVPPGHESWASSNLSFGRWMTINLLIQVFWMVPLLAFLVATGGLTVRFFGWAIVVLTVGMIPFTALQLRRRVISALADPPVPPAHEVFKQIGEPVPPT